MSTSNVATSSTPGQNSGHRHRHHHGRTRKHKPANGESVEVQTNVDTPQDAGQTQLTMRPASLPPSKPKANTIRKTATGRSFGGNLTASSSGGNLQADAAVFVPGQVMTNSSQPVTHNRHRKRRYSKSTAPDILTRTHEDIDHGQYECPICTSEVQRTSKIWSCRDCWTVFHLTCVKKWASNHSSSTQQTENDGSTSRSWRCPGCNLFQNVQPKLYTCWCEKEVDPRPPTGVPPHSCGNSCGRDRARKCPHPCQLTCHAGPCPPCTFMGPKQSCFCGKQENARRCQETDYGNGWSCGEICGDLMPCGVHTCPRPCHEGLCGSCEVVVDAECYCGQEKSQIACHDQGKAVESRRSTSKDDNEIITMWTGTFHCANTCNRLFDCNIHQCHKSCHAQDLLAAHCPNSPDVVLYCPCGKTMLSDLLETPRSNCNEPVPNCDKLCHKTLDCGHLCEQICHAGDCRSCTKIVDISCVCGRTSCTSLCHQGKMEKPQCMRICHALLNCGRHACDEHCCPGERKAAERTSTKRKQRPLGSVIAPINDYFEAEHICTRECGRLLKCGNHTCMELCHKGPCGACREAVFEEISCHCGKTVLQPPLPCGTKAPPCRFPCERRKACGHKQVQHNCHLDDESCPKCPFWVDRPCMCGKKVLSNQPCWFLDTRCGQICGKKLKCGSHFCRKLCHRPGECEDANGQTCQQACGKTKTLCGHPDEAVCHSPFPCKEDKPCPSKIFITCECQAIKQEARCGACKGNEGNLKKTLACNEECARLERNRKLALALNIEQSRHVDGGDHIPYSTETLDFYQQNSALCQLREREFRVFAESPDEKRLRMNPCPSPQRAFLHHLAEDFGFDSESMDPEPHRHVLILKTPKFVSAPSKTLAECIRIRMTKRPLTERPTVVNPKQSSTINSKDVDLPFNALIITSPRFGLTEEDVRSTLSSDNLTSKFKISFLPSEEVLVTLSSLDTKGAELEQSLRSQQDVLSQLVARDNLGMSLDLCTVDSSLNVLRRENDSSNTGAVSGGWSRVVARSAKTASKSFANATRDVGSVRGGNVFSALNGLGSGSGNGKMTFTKQNVKKEKEKVKEVVDDWEMEMKDDEEEKMEGIENEEIKTEGKNTEEEKNEEIKSNEVKDEYVQSGEAKDDLNKTENQKSERGIDDLHSQDRVIEIKEDADIEAQEAIKETADSKESEVQE